MLLAVVGMLLSLHHGASPQQCWEMLNSPQSQPGQEEAFLSWGLESAHGLVLHRPALDVAEGMICLRKTFLDWKFCKLYFRKETKQHRKKPKPTTTHKHPTLWKWNTLTVYIFSFVLYAQCWPLCLPWPCLPQRPPKPCRRPWWTGWRWQSSGAGSTWRRWSIPCSAQHSSWRLWLSRPSRPAPPSVRPLSHRPRSRLMWRGKR